MCLSPHTASIISDIAVAIAACITSIVAIVGLNSWRKELKGRAGFETARTLARCTYNVRDALASARRPLIEGREFPPDFWSDPHHDTPGKKKADAYAHVFRGRWAPLIAAVQEFDSAALEAEALWGKQLREATDNLRRCVNNLAIARDEHLENIGGLEDLDKEYTRKIRQEVFSLGKDNELSQQIGSAIESIEKLVRPHLAR